MTRLMLETRRVQRGDVRGLYGVRVARDRRGLSYDVAARRIRQAEALDRLFDLVGELADTSEGGIGVRYFGQRRRATNLFTRYEAYWLKLALGDLAHRAPRAFVRGSCLPFLLVRGICCWHELGDDGWPSKVGFDLERSNHPKVVSFVAGLSGERRSEDLTC